MNDFSQISVKIHWMIYILEQLQINSNHEQKLLKVQCLVALILITLLFRKAHFWISNVTFMKNKLMSEFGSFDNKGSLIAKVIIFMIAYNASLVLWIQVTTIHKQAIGISMCVMIIIKKRIQFKHLDSGSFDNLSVLFCCKNVHLIICIHSGRKFFRQWISNLGWYLRTFLLLELSYS